MKLNENVSIIDLALYFKKQQILILGDFHIGYEEALNKSGILIPRHQHKDTLVRLESILKSNPVKTIIINGDFKHEFGKISETEWRHALRTFDLLSKYSENIILIKGNHDAILGPLAEKKNLTIHEYYTIDDYYICHGHIIPKDKNFKNSKKIIIGHEHPAISLYTKTRTETYKCFLIGKYNDKTLIVLPSFNLVLEGTDVLKEKTLSPFLSSGIDNFKVIIIQDAPYDFGKIKDLKKLLKKE